MRSDPEDTEEGTRLFYAAGGADDMRALARMKASADGQRLLDAREPLRVSAADRERLRALGEGSLGYALAAFFDEEDISSEGLAAATFHVEPPPRDAEHAFHRDRGRDVHDILHVLTGYGRDVLGEIALHGFTFAQYGNHAYGLLGAMACSAAFFMGRRDAPAIFLQAYRRGRNAPFLPAVDWNAALVEPLADLRQQLSLGPAPTYEPMDPELLAA